MINGQREKDACLLYVDLFNFTFEIYRYMGGSECACTHMQKSTQSGRFPGTGYYELPDISDRNQTLVLYNSIKCS